VARSCVTCESDDREFLEGLGERALRGEISWREAARQAGLTRHQGLQNHMEVHWVDPVTTALNEAEAEMDDLVREAMTALADQFRVASPEVKPLLLVAMKNLEGLQDTKPSQQHLINALKTVQDITGMKAETRLMLDFANAMFGQAQAKKVEASHTPVKELEVVDAEVV
jgi:hypothetical protein